MRSAPGTDEYDYVVADVFTTTPLEGNPVAVFLNAGEMTPDVMQRVAAEMHLSETVFVLPPTADGDIRVRIFTPVNELPFAGHPTLGAAVVLGQAHASDQMRMETSMGTVSFSLDRDRAGVIQSALMSQPIPTWEPYVDSARLLVALGLGTSTTPIEIYRNGPRHAFVGLESPLSLAGLTPDHKALAELPDVAANCFSGSGDRWELRMFSPAYGVVEDAATGSAAGALAVHLARNGLTPFGSWIEIHQGLQIRRPSVMRARAVGAADQIERVDVSGDAVVVAQGTLFI